MATEVEDLIAEQTLTNLNLEIMSENKDIFEKLLAESVMSNSLMDRNTSSIFSLEKKIGDSIKFLSGLSSNISNQNLIEDKTNAIEVLPAIKATDGSLEAIEDNGSLEGIEDNGDNSLIVLNSIDNNIAKLVNDSAESQLEQSGVAVDRQDDGEKSDSKKSGLLSGMGKLPGIGAISAGLSSFASAAVAPLLAAASVGLFAKGAFDALSDDKLIKDLTGKVASELEGAEKVLLGFAGGLSQLTFGLLETKDIFDFVLPVQDKLQKSLDFLFDPADGVFGRFASGFSSMLDGNFKDGFKDIFANIFEIPFMAGEAVTNLVKEGAKGIVRLFAPDHLVKELEAGIDGLFDPITKFFSETIPKLGKSIANVFVETSSALIQPIINLKDNLLAAFKDTTAGVFEGIAKLFKGDITGGMLEIIGSIVKLPIDLLSSTATLLIESTSNLFNLIPKDIINAAFDKITSIPEAIAAFFTKFASNISGLIGNKLKSVGESLPSFLGGDALKSISSLFIDDSKEEATDSSPVKSKGLFKAVVTKDQGLNVPQVKSPNIGASKTVELSKQRLEDKNINVEVAAPQPVIIQPQPRDKQVIVKKRESNDLTLAMMGLGNL
jgi:hypothetical protein